MRFFKVVDAVSKDESRDYDGGEYTFGRVVAVEGLTPVGIRYWTSAGFPFCALCGRFTDHLPYECYSPTARASDAVRWTFGIQLDMGEDYYDRFAPIVYGLLPFRVAQPAEPELDPEPELDEPEPELDPEPELTEARSADVETFLTWIRAQGYMTDDRDG